MNSSKRTARIAGSLYLLVAVFYGFAHFFRVSLTVPGDAAATVNNIMASEWLFRFAFVSGLVGQVCFVLVGLALYVLLKPVNKNLALLMVIFVLVSVPIAMLNLLNQFAALLLLSGVDYLAVFEANQLHAFVMLFLSLLDHGTLIAQIFWGIWLLPLGYLVFKSGFLPKILGILLMIAAFGYFIGSLASFLFPTYGRIIELVYYEPAIAEISFMLWLLIRGVNESKLKSASAGR
jgi:hypothetical protein